MTAQRRGTGRRPSSAGQPDSGKTGGGGCCAATTPDSGDGAVVRCQRWEVLITWMAILQERTLRQSPLLKRFGSGLRLSQRLAQPAPGCALAAAAPFQDRQSPIGRVTGVRLHRLRLFAQAYRRKCVADLNLLLANCTVSCRPWPSSRELAIQRGEGEPPRPPLRSSK